MLLRDPMRQVKTAFLHGSSCVLQTLRTEGVQMGYGSQNIWEKHITGVFPS